MPKSSTVRQNVRLCWVEVTVLFASEPTRQRVFVPWGEFEAFLLGLLHPDPGLVLIKCASSVLSDAELTFQVHLLVDLQLFDPSTCEAQPLHRLQADFF